jgi:transcriptional regulator with XRE-family HTH domain
MLSALGQITANAEGLPALERIMNAAGADGEEPFPGLDGSPVDATVLRMLIGAQLRRFREAAGITPEQAGYAIRASRSKISRLEKGKVGLKSRDVADLLTLYGVTDEGLQSRFLALTGQSATQDWWTRYSDILPGWFETYLGLEAAATAIRTFEVQFVHGLFQTEDYARAVTLRRQRTLSADEEAERRVALRLKRQELLSRPDPPRIWSVMDEAVLRRPVGGPAVMRAQCRHLIEVAHLEHVSLQVIPFASGTHAGESGSFSVLRFEERDLPDVVYIEQLTSALYLDQRRDVEHYLEVVDDLSSQALTPAATTRFIEQAARDL